MCSQVLLHPEMKVLLKQWLRPQYASDELFVGSPILVVESRDTASIEFFSNYETNSPTSMPTSFSSAPLFIHHTATITHVALLCATP